MSQDNGAVPTEANGSKPAPATPSALNLDELEREGDIAKPFEFVHGGRTFRLLDPKEIDWQDLLLGLRNPALFVRFALPEAEQQEFLRTKVPAWKMNALLERYQQHYGLPSLGELSGLLR